MNYPRHLEKTLSTRLEEKAPLIQVIVGPRQVGKTTAMRAVLKNKGLYKTADYPAALPVSVIEEWWEETLSSKSEILGIDEIQKIPGWSEVIKKKWDDAKQKPKLILTGSSALMVEKGLKETLAGRFELIKAQHWNLKEAQNVFNSTPKQFVEFGCYPGAQPFLEDIERWGAYIRDSIVEPAIGRDLLQLHPIQQPALLRQLFGLAVSLPCQIVSFQKLLGQLQNKGTLPTIKHYLDLMGQGFLVSGIEKYSTASFHTKRSSPKLIIHDNALIRAFERPIQTTISEKKFGHYFENAVGSRFLESGWETFYWKDRDLEVDFVVIGPQNQHWAIEAKSSPTNKNELKGLFEFTKRFPKFEPCLVSLVNQNIEGITTIPVEEALSLS